MTESEITDAVRRCRHDGMPIEVAGSGTLLSMLPEPPPPSQRLSLREHRGVVSYDAADLTVTVRAGTTVEELAVELEDRGQECPIEGPGSTVGGRVASGLSGLRRLGVGPVRDWLLGARFVTAEGSVIRLGGRTVKNVTGYDLTRLSCGSWGTLGILTELTLRVRPRSLHRGWYVTEESKTDLLRRIYRPASIIRTRERTHVLLDGHPEDCREQARLCGLVDGPPPRTPEGARLAVPPGHIPEALARISGEYAAEIGVGIIHADPISDELIPLRLYCESVGGRLLVLRRGTGARTFGNVAASEFDRRVKRSLDPSGLFAPWRFAA